MGRKGSFCTASSRRCKIDAARIPRPNVAGGSDQQQPAEPACAVRGAAADRAEDCGDVVMVGLLELWLDLLLPRAAAVGRRRPALG